jgi:hypothetical protein
MMAAVAERSLDPDFDLDASGAQPRSGGKRQITRNRTSYSCQACRRRKVKCDKQHPVCSGCLKSNEECIYGKQDDTASNVAASDLTAGSKRRSSFTPNVREAPAASSTFDTSNAVVLGLQQQLERLTNLMESMRRDSTHSGSTRGGPLTPNSQSSQRGSTSENSERRTTDDSPDSSQSQTDLSQTLSAMELSKRREDLRSHSKGHFLSDLEGELEQLKYLIRGPHAIPTEQQVPNSAPLEHSDCNMPRPAPDARALVDEPIDIHHYQRLEKHNHHGDCGYCYAKSGDKSTLLMPKRLKNLDTRGEALDITTGMPTEAQSNVLFRAWLSGVYPLQPMFPLRLVFKRYWRFWEWKHSIDSLTTGEVETADMLVLPSLFAIWYTGALSLSLPAFQRIFPGAERATVCAYYHDQCIRMLNMVSFPGHNQTWLLAALVMLQSAPCGEEEPLQNSSYVNMLVRLAQAQGIHREPSLAGLHSYDAEIKRRVWWEIVQLDTSLAVSCGFSTCSSDDNADARLISPVKEMFLGSEEEKKMLTELAETWLKREPLDDAFGESSSVISVPALVARAYSQIALTTRKIIAMHMRTKPVTKGDLTEMNIAISVTEGEVRNVINSIPTKGAPELGFIPERSNASAADFDNDPSLESTITEDEMTYWTGILVDDKKVPLSRFYRHRTAAFHRWARIYLSMMCDKMHCIAYAPFLKNNHSKLWAGGRQCALHHTSSYFRKFISLADDPAMAAFRWSWAGTAQPMHAAIILLVDLYERPRSVEAARSRALIDQVFALSAPEAGIVGGGNGATYQRPFREGGSDAWELLRNLRATAWRKAGLEPNFLWTENQQITIGVARALTTEDKVAQAMREDLMWEDKELGPPETRIAVSGALSQLHETLHNRDLAHARETHKADSDDIWKAALSHDTTATNTTQSHRLEGQQPMPFRLRSRPVPASPAPQQGYLTHLNAGHYDGALPLHMVDGHVRGAIGVAQGHDEISDVADGLGVSKAGQLYAAPTQSEPMAGQQQSHIQPMDDGMIAADNTGAEFDFDWKAWDAAFNHYTGFTDLMMLDDVSAWE